MKFQSITFLSWLAAVGILSSTLLFGCVDSCIDCPDPTPTVTPTPYIESPTPPSPPTPCPDEDEDGYCPKDGDCNNEDDTIYPEALEVCDDIDQNCDGDPIGDDTQTYFLDLDGDGFGSPDATTTLEACALPDGYSKDPDDCNDELDSVNPDAPEICDGLDNDCNLMTDDMCWDGEDARWDESVWQ